MIIVQTGYTRSEMDKYSYDWKSSDILPSSKVSLDILCDGITWHVILGAEKQSINPLRLGAMVIIVKDGWN
ncbi:MAG: hypothetical protein ABFC94_01850 [Syntrophomonas sp.]